MMFYTVVTASRARSIGNGLTYKSDTVVDVGTLVRVPLRHARIEGIIVARPSAVQGTMNVKEIDAIVSRTPLLSQNFIEFLRDAADDSFATMRDMLTIALPKPPWSRIAVAAAPANPHDKITNGKPLLLVDHGGEALLERYRDAIADARKRGRQCLVLAPNATRARTLFHELSTTVDAGTSLLAIDQSRIMDERRVMEAAMHGTAALIVGLRSAVFFCRCAIAVSSFLMKKMHALTRIRCARATTRATLRKNARRKNMHNSSAHRRVLRCKVGIVRRVTRHGILCHCRNRTATHRRRSLIYAKRTSARRIR
jgi:primosomal protein N'